MRKEEKKPIMDRPRAGTQVCAGLRCVRLARTKKPLKKHKNGTALRLKALERMPEAWERSGWMTLYGRNVGRWGIPTILVAYFLRLQAFRPLK
ncbi:hypothetical protein EVAR_91676_1 [Eumeta japonica]|uniref:Uncharacterized protein n=1 Tax=Eumeta variegata TaxID=151549 RepID=A0A4C1Z1D9_EUMVA|nr:hypothetical protein EVAR_91676_1 [Eumeta japonica]